MFDDALKTSVPGGNLTKPLILATGALILAKWLGGGKEATPEAPGRLQRPDEIMAPDYSAPSPVPRSGQRQPQTIDINHPSDVSDEHMPGGLGGLLEKLRKGGLGQEADS